MRERSIFIEALEKDDPAAQAAFLDAACGGDSALRQRIEILLQAHSAAGGLLDRPAVSPAGHTGDDAQYAHTVASESATERVGARLGPYKLLQQIGEGGMGTVWMAEQIEPVRRMVALKIIKPGMDSSQVIARFEAERQALAVMDHPNIAKVFDAGTSDAGRPYFVMELVKGTPITTYCDEHRLALRERLGLFVAICQALQHAHQKGIIHRDIKPSNVLVAPYDGHPVVKVIDFGVAKATGQRLTERTMFTEFGAIVGTLQYMSPEQAELNNQDVDTRSDIYSLGVLLYELLTGTTPLDMKRLRGSALAAVLLAINEDEPPKPSTRLTDSQDSLPSVAAQRHSDPIRLPKLVRGELDWIVMKALEKNRTRRYETAGGLARDVDRFLLDEPVEACPPTVRYRLRKFLRKHRPLVSGVAAVFVALCLAVAGTTYGLNEARRQRDVARQSQSAAEDARKAEAKERAIAQAMAIAESKAAQNAAVALIEADTQRGKALEEKERAEKAEAQAVNEREREAQARGQALDALARSQLDQAHAVRLAGLSGRRWTALDLVKRAEVLRSRESASVAQPADAAGDDNATRGVLYASLPSQAELRSAAIAALLLADARVARVYNGFTHSVSPDGQFAVCASIEPEKKSGAVTIIDLQTGDIARRWEGKEAEPLSGLLLALGPRAEQLAVLSLDQRKIKVWDVKEKKLLRTLTRPSRPPGNADGDNRDRTPATPATTETIRQLTFSPDGRCLAGILTGQALEAFVALWQQDGPAEGQTLAAVQGVPLVSVAFSPDSACLAFASQAKQATVWNIAENRAKYTFELPIVTDGAVVFDPSGERLAIHGREGEAKSTSSSRLLLWEIAENREVARLDTGAIVSTTPISFAPDGRRVAVSGSNRTIAVFSLPISALGGAPPVRVNNGLLPQTIAWSASGKLLSGGLDGLKQWELASSEAVSAVQLDTDQAPHGVSRLALSPDGETIAVEAWPGPECILYNLVSGQRIRILETTIDVGNVGLRFSPDAKQLMRFGQSGLRIWDVQSGEVQQQPAEQPAVQAVTSVGVRPTGGVLVADAPSTGQFTIFDTAAGKVVWQPQQRKFGTAALVSPDGQFAVAYQVFAVGGGERPIQVWNLDRNQQRCMIPSPPGKSFQTLLEISPDSRWIATFHFGGDVAKAFPRGTPESRSAVEALTGSANLVTAPTMLTFGAGFSGFVHPDQPWFGDVWNAETGERHCQIQGPVNIENYAFSPNGRYLAVGLRGGAVRVWDIPAAKELFDWQRPAGSTETQAVPHQIAFTSDSSTLAVPDLNSPTLHLLNLTRLKEQLKETSLDW